MHTTRRHQARRFYSEICSSWLAARPWGASDFTRAVQNTMSTITETVRETVT